MLFRAFRGIKASGIDVMGVPIMSDVRCVDGMMGIYVCRRWWAVVLNAMVIPHCATRTRRLYSLHRARYVIQLTSDFLLELHLSLDMTSDHYYTSPQSENRK